MTTEPRTAPLLPSYGSRTLAELGSSILAALGGSGVNSLGLPPSRKICLLVVDGLGWELLRDHPAAAPFLNELAMNAQPLAAGFPATTVTSLTSLGTGSAPGQHGVLGYQVAMPGRAPAAERAALGQPDRPGRWQPRSTIYERATAAGIAAYYVAPRGFRNSGLTGAAMRGARVPARRQHGRAGGRGRRGAARGGPRSWSPCTTPTWTATGHGHGVRSDAWRYQLAHVDKLAEQLAGALPSGTALAHHRGPRHGRRRAAGPDRRRRDLPELRAGVALLGGEPRARHVYARPGAAADVLAAWREVLGNRAWVVSREEAITAGWFGPVEPATWRPDRRRGRRARGTGRSSPPRTSPRVRPDRHARLADRAATSWSRNWCWPTSERP